MWCRKCNQDKEDEQFSIRSHEKGTRQSACKECHTKYRREHHLKHHVRYLQKAKQQKQILREWVFEYLKTHPCVDCGEGDPVVLEFDHVEGDKVGNISKMIGQGSLKRLLEEVKKCQVRCANCHRRKTASQFDWWIARVA